MGGAGKGICGTLLFAPWVVWHILNICHDSYDVSNPVNTHNRKKFYPHAHQHLTCFEQVRLHDIKDSTFAINRTRPNDEKTEILLGCVRIRHWAFPQNVSLSSYNETLDRPFLMSPCPKIKPILSWDKQDGEKIEFRSICEKKLIKYVDNWTNFGIKSYEFGLQNIIG